VVGRVPNQAGSAYPAAQRSAISPGVGSITTLVAAYRRLGTLLTNQFVSTILKMRATRDGSHAEPVSAGTPLATNLLIVRAFPVLTATFAMALLDRYLAFTSSLRRARATR